MNKLIIWDLDGTLTDPTPFLHLIENTPKNWDEWNKACVLHKPIPQALHLYKMHCAAGDTNIIFTARKENCRIYTEQWLADHKLNMMHAGLYMRALDDFRPDYETKLDMLRSLRQTGQEPFLVYDDRASVVQMYRDNGVRCFHVADGGF